MSTITASNLNDGTTTVATTYVTNGSAKAWINLNGTGTIAARDSLNISSTTDVGNGYYRPNFASNMSSDTYTVSGSVIGSTSGYYYSFVTADGGALTASSFDSEIIHYAGSRNDMTYVHFIIHGDLA